MRGEKLCASRSGGVALPILDRQARDDVASCELLVASCELRVQVVVEWNDGVWSMERGRWEEQSW